MLKKYLTCIALFLCFGFSQAQLTPLFIPNGGQWDEQILHKMEFKGGNAYVERDGVVIQLLDEEFFHKLHAHGDPDSVLKADALKYEFIGANYNAKVSRENLGGAKYNFFLGKDESKWARNLSGARHLIFEDYYPGIDMHLISTLGGIKYEFHLDPGADPNLIKLRVRGGDDVQLVREAVNVTTTIRKVIDKAPIAFQNNAKGKEPVAVKYELQDSVVSFNLGEYNKDEALVIDPDLVFSTFSGSTTNNFGFTATYDDKGFLYSGSSIFGIGYPTTIGAYQILFASNPATGNELVYDPIFGWVFAGYTNTDIGITKYDTTGTKLIYSTYLGGELCEVPHSIIVNSKDELVMLGTTASSTYPVSTSAYDQTFAGGSSVNLSRGIAVNYTVGSDIVVSKLSADGSQLLGSTYLGGSANDGLNVELNYNYADQLRGDVAIDENDNIYITSCTYSTDLQNFNGFSSSNAGGCDGLVAKFNPDLSSLSWGSYLGGAENDALYSIVLDSAENIVVAGGTGSSNLPTTAGVVQGTYQGGSTDGFVAKIANDGSTLNALTYLGTHAYDQSYFVRIDNAQNIYLYGQSASMDGSLIMNAGYSSVNSGMFISKLQNDLSSFIWSTTFGSGTNEINLSPTAFAVDICNNIYLSGWGSNSIGFELIPNWIVDPTGLTGHNGGRGTNGMPVTFDAFQSTTDGHDFYLMVIDDQASTLQYASYYGGAISQEHVDGGTSRFDRKGNIYQSVCAGCGGNSDFPIEPNPGAWSPTNNASCNNGVFKFDFQIPSIVADFLVPNQGCLDTAYRFVNTSRELGATTYRWDFGDNTTSTAQNPSHQYAQSGTYEVKLVIEDPISCNLIDSITKTITLRDDSLITSIADTSCFGDSLQTVVNLVYHDSTMYDWSPGVYASDSTIQEPKLFTDSSRTFELIVSAEPGCSDTVIYDIMVPSYVLETTDAVACSGDSAEVVVSGNSNFTSYQWSTSTGFPDTLNNIADSTFRYLLLSDTTFYVRIIDTSGCAFIDSVQISAVVFELELSNDTIVCDLTPIEGRVLNHSQSYLDSISWTPSGEVVIGGDSVVATLNIYDYLSDFYVYARDTFGCEDRDTLRIVDNSLDFDLPDTTVCLGDTVDLGYQLGYNPLFTYQWLPGIVNDPDSLQTWALLQDSIELVLVVNNGVCDDSVSHFISVNSIEIDLPSDTVLCNFSEDLRVEVNGEDSLFYTWSETIAFADTLLSGEGRRVYFMPPAPLDSDVFVEAVDDWGCSDTAHIQVYNSIYDLTYASDTTLCRFDTVFVQANEDLSNMGMLNFAWTPSEVIVGDTASSSVSIAGDPGQYTVAVSSQNSFGCTDYDEITVSVASLDTALVEASIDRDTILNTETALITALPEGHQYALSPLEITTIQDENTFEVSPGQTRTYMVSVMDSLYVGCQDSASVEVLVYKFICDLPYVYVPNAFSPNGDGENDVLYVRGSNITELYFAIFNRWGQKVFETTQSHIGWDGTYKGMPIDPAVYDYYFEYECLGEEKRFKKGNITLIR